MRPLSNSLIAYLTSYGFPFFSCKPVMRQTDRQTDSVMMPFSGRVTFKAYPSATKKSSFDATATSVGSQNRSVSSLLLAGSNFLPSTKDGSCLPADSNLNTCNHKHTSLSHFLRVQQQQALKRSY